MATAADATGPFPEHLQCNRSDGRGWRCKRRVMEEKKVCDIHYVQGRLRQYKEKVPDSLKFKHGENRNASNSPESVTIALPAPNPEFGADVSELRKDELIQIYGEKDGVGTGKRRRVVKVKKRRREGGGEGSNVRVLGKELTRDLPFGVMEIAPPEPPEPEKEPEKEPTKELVKEEENGVNVVKLVKETENGVKLGVTGSGVVAPRKFRSKNPDRAPIETVKVVPAVASVKKRKRRKCHWCKRSNNRSLVKCLDCKRQFFCDDCIEERHQDEEKIQSRCSVCRGTCNCDSCQTGGSKDVENKEIMKKPSCKDTELMCYRYLIHLLLPVIKRINQELDAEKQMVAKFEGKNVFEVAVRQVDGGSQMQLSCDNCNSAIMDLHRSCLRCSYVLCLRCCGYFSQNGRVASLESSCSSKKKLDKKQVNRCMETAGSINIASVTCLHREIEGCGESLLDLRCVFPFNWIKDVEQSAEDILSSHEDGKTSDDSLNCSLCADGAQEATKEKESIAASRRKSSSDNFLYCPNAHGDNVSLLKHFQKHWRRGQPVIVRNVVLDGESNVSWDPVAIFCRYLERNTQSEHQAGESSPCLDWYEIEFGVKESFSSFEDSHRHLQRETLKLKTEFSSALSERIFADYYAEIFNSLPLQEYTNSRSGILNLAAISTRDSQVPKLGQQLKILCGSHEEVARGDLVTSLHHHSHDLINILVYASESTCTTEQLHKIRGLLRESSRNKQESCGQNLQNGARLEHSEITDEVGEDRTLEEAHLSSMTNLEANNASPVKAHASDTDSDVSMMCSGTNESPEKPTNQPVNLDETPKCSEKKTSSEPSMGALWDIFRREDVPKLLDYIKKHSSEFNGEVSLHKEAAYPILDRRIFIDLAHKMRLKEELGFEPWTFNQRVGEAVVIPAGCVYQIRSLKSCIHVTTGFISPENAVECSKLMEQLRLLPRDHRAQKGILQLEKMAIDSVSKAVEEVRKLV
ncbi:Lysine-specific demethylase JMJ28-like protein [Drosera capensis]